MNRALRSILTTEKDDFTIYVLKLSLDDTINQANFTLNKNVSKLLKLTWGSLPHFNSNSAILTKLYFLIPNYFLCVLSSTSLQNLLNWANFFCQTLITYRPPSGLMFWHNHYKSTGHRPWANFRYFCLKKSNWDQMRQT